MSRITDIFIKRPVLATVLSLLILILGVRSVLTLPVRQFPKLDDSVITIQTSYAGASSELIESFITSPLEKAVSGAKGIDYLTSQSQENLSTITVYLRQGEDADSVFTEIMSKVTKAQSVLPHDAERPVLMKGTGGDVMLMYISFIDPHMSPQQLTDYVTRVVQPKLSTLKGVGQATVFGGSPFAMRIWLDPIRMAGYGVTAADVTSALRRNNLQSTAGKTKGLYTAIVLGAETDLKTVEGFNNIAVKTNDAGSLVHLSDVAKVELGSASYDTSVYLNGKKAIFMGIGATPEANPLSVIDLVRKTLPKIRYDLPPGMKLLVNYDATRYIKASIKEVIRTLFEATLIVVLVIFLFLGSWRTVIIPVVTIPLSLVGVFSMMLFLGYSINLLTLLALVLAIGMVVDDAIVVVENIHRHIEGGASPFDAALQGAREIAMPVISMTLTLAAVYAPIGFMGGLTGSLFSEFAFSLASCVILSGVIALTLSPMMCSKLLSAHNGNSGLSAKVDYFFSKLKAFYKKLLSGSLENRIWVVAIALFVLMSCCFLYVTSRKELAPTEDQGAIFIFGKGPEYANLDYMEKFSRQISPILSKFPAIQDYFAVNGINQVNDLMAGTILKPWDERRETQREILPKLQAQLSGIAGLRLQPVPLPALPTTGSLMPVKFVITSLGKTRAIMPYVEKIMNKARQSGLFMFISEDVQFNKPQATFKINRNKAAQMGISMEEISSAMSAFLGGNYLNHFSLQQRSYQVIPQIQRQFREHADQIRFVHVKTKDGRLVPLSTIIDLQYSTSPNALNHFQQLNAVTLSGMLSPGVALGQAVSFLEAQAKGILPPSMSFDYGGQTRQYMQEGNSLLYTFVFSLLIIFLVLAAQFESFRDPLVIMVSVPMAICGALLPINWGLASINIYTQIGLVTLIGLITKHGILMVEFANRLRHDQSLPMVDAILEAASVRLRPVLMTTAAMVVGVLPLLLATGAGAVSRFSMGLVIASGMTIGTIFTLFIVPTIYTLKPAQILFFILAALLLCSGVILWV